MMRRVGVAVVALTLVSACSSDPESVEVTGETGYCQVASAEFSGEPLTGSNLPGRVVDVVVECPDGEMSDDRLSGAVRTEFQCEYSNRDGQIVADCVSSSVVTNDGGSWREDDGTFTITGTDVGVQGVVLQEGVRVGTGDYEGLQFTYRMEGVEHTYPWTVTGTIEPKD
jgi:hypothetical protein